MTKSVSRRDIIIFPFHMSHDLFDAHNWKVNHVFDGKGLQGLVHGSVLLTGRGMPADSIEVHATVMEHKLMLRALPSALHQRHQVMAIQQPRSK